MQNLFSGTGAPPAMLRRQFYAEQSKTALSADEDKLDRMVAGAMAPFSPTTKKPKFGKFETKLDAYDATVPEDHPLKGGAEEVKHIASGLLTDPQMQGYSPAEVIGAARDIYLNQTDEKTGISKLQSAHEYKRRKDTDLFNAFGLLGENKGYRALPGAGDIPGYEIYRGLQKQHEGEEVDKEGILPSSEDLASTAAWGAAFGLISAASRGAGGKLLSAVTSRAAATGAMKGMLSMAGLEAALKGAAAWGLGDVVMSPVTYGIKKSEWYQSRMHSDSVLDKAKAVLTAGAPAAIAGAEIQKAFDKAIPDLVDFARNGPGIGLNPYDFREMGIGQLKPVQEMASEMINRKTMKDAYGQYLDVLKTGTPEEIMSAHAGVKAMIEKDLAKGHLMSPEYANFTGKFGVNPWTGPSRLKTSVNELPTLNEFSNVRPPEAPNAGFTESHALPTPAIEKPPEYRMLDPRPALMRSIGKETPEFMDVKRMTDSFSKKLEMEYGYVPEHHNFIYGYTENGKFDVTKFLQSRTDEQLDQILGRAKDVGMRPAIYESASKFFQNQLVQHIEEMPERTRQALGDYKGLLYSTQQKKFISGIRVNRFKDAIPQDVESLLKVPAEPLMTGSTKATEFNVGGGMSSPFVKGLLGLVGTVGISLGALGLVTPDEAEAGTISQVPKLFAGIFNFAERATSKLGKEELQRGIGKTAEELKASGFIASPLKEGQTYLNDDSLIRHTSFADVAAEMYGNTRDWLRRIKGLPLGLDKMFSPNARGNIYYKTFANPAVNLAQTMTAERYNAQAAMTVMKNIFSTNGIDISEKATQSVIDRMAPLAERYGNTATVYNALLADSEKNSQVALKLQQFVAGQPKVKKAISDKLGQLELEIKATNDMIAKLAPEYAKFTNETMGAYQELAQANPMTRVALALEDSKFEKYPWLQGLLKPNEVDSISQLRGVMQNFSERMRSAGQKPMTEDYIHHAWHPNWRVDEQDMKNILYNLGMSPEMADAKIAMKNFFHRSDNSLMMVPDAAYAMEKYIPDAERRIGFSTFWGKRSDPNSWINHSNLASKASETLRNYWEGIKSSYVPPDFQWGGKLVDSYVNWEVFRLLGFNASAAFKHLLKVTGTMASTSPADVLSRVHDVAAMTAKNYLSNPENIFGLAGKLGVSDKIVRGNVDLLANAYGRMAHYGHLLDTDMLPAFRGAGSTFEQWSNKMLNGLKYAADKGSFAIQAIESFDRTDGVLAALSMATKQGMTARQALYGIADTIVKNSFMGGALNAKWMKDPWARALVMFQTTAFKIFERRLVAGLRGYEALGDAWKLVKRQGMDETLRQVASAREFLSTGQKMLKQNLFYDTMRSNTDVFGTTTLKTFLKEAMYIGGLLGMANAGGATLAPQLVHLPFFREGTEASLALSPLASTVVKTTVAKKTGQQEDLSWIEAFADNYTKNAGLLPATLKKVERIVDNDIPEIYDNSIMRYFLGIRNAPSRD